MTRTRHPAGFFVCGVSNVNVAKFAVGGITATAWLLLAAFCSLQPRPAAADAAPTITGSPPTTAAIGERYSFTPIASDADGDELRFVIKNRPAWLTFSYQTGGLSGAPTEAGTWADIVIYAKDGSHTVAMQKFTITVVRKTSECTCPPSGTALLTWKPPTQNTDNSPLTDLAAYRIVYGTSRTAMNQRIEVRNPALTAYLVNGLSAGTWYFAVKAVNAGGIESALSNVASKTVQ